MALPILANTTCDIYRTGNSPPAAADVAAVLCHLKVDFERRQEVGENLDSLNKFTHILLVDISVDIRDAWNSFTSHGNPDIVYIPDKDGTPYRVTFVERHHRGQSSDHKRVYLNRLVPPEWEEITPV